jgi:hypothetical protein
MAASSSKPTLREQLQELNAVTSQEAAALAAQGKKATVRQLALAPFLTFVRTYVGQSEWRNGITGLIQAMFAAYAVFVCHAKLWELHHVTTKTPPPPHS